MQKLLACVVIWIALSFCAFPQTDSSSLRSILGEIKPVSSSSSSSSVTGGQQFNITYCVGAKGCSGVFPYHCLDQSLAAKADATLCRAIPAGAAAWFPIPGIPVNVNFTGFIAAPIDANFWTLSLFADQACQKSLIHWTCGLSLCCMSDFYILNTHFNGWRINPA